VARPGPGGGPGPDQISPSCRSQHLDAIDMSRLLQWLGTVYFFAGRNLEFGAAIPGRAINEWPGLAYWSDRAAAA